MQINEHIFYNLLNPQNTLLHLLVYYLITFYQNHHVFHLKLEKFLKKEQPDYNVESTKEASEFTIYGRAWSYIEQVDIDSNDDIEAIISFDKKLLNSTLKGAVKYFEDLEDYKKCAHLFAIQKLLK